MSYAFILQSFKLRTKTIHKTLNPVWDEELVYHGIFNADFTHGEVTPIIRPFSVLPEVEIPQSMLVNFSRSCSTLVPK